MIPYRVCLWEAIAHGVQLSFRPNFNRLNDVFLNKDLCDGKLSNITAEVDHMGKFKLYRYKN